MLLRFESDLAMPVAVSVPAGVEIVLMVRLLNEMQNVKINETYTVVCLIAYSRSDWCHNV